MDRETMRLAILSAAEEWREDTARGDALRGSNRPPRPGEIGRARAKKSLRGQAKEILSGEKAGDERKGHGNTRLPYGLCKKYGIEVPPGTTPYEAWELLKGKGVNPKEEYRKLKERGEGKAAGGRKAGKEVPKETGEKAGGKTGARPEPERIEPMAFRTAEEATEYLEDRCNGFCYTSWAHGVCPEAKIQIAGTVAALDSRYHALDAGHNCGSPVLFEDGLSARGAIASAMCLYGEGCRTYRMAFYSGYFKDGRALKRARGNVRKGRGRKGGYFYMPSAEGMEIAYIAAHEYGHCLQYRILRDKGTSGRGEADFEAKLMMWEIMGIAQQIEPGCNPGKPISEGGCISEYGRTDWYEFFAECFANSVCGEPNVLGRAMAIYLDRHGIGRAQ